MTDYLERDFTESMLELEVQKLATSRRLARSVAETAEMKVLDGIVRGEIDSMLLTISADVLAHRIEEKATVVFREPRPASWWQHAKRDLFPTFSRILKRPPKMLVDSTEVRVENFARFPEHLLPNYPSQLGAARAYQKISYHEQETRPWE